MRTFRRLPLPLAGGAEKAHIEWTRACTAFNTRQLIRVIKDAARQREAETVVTCSGAPCAATKLLLLCVNKEIVRVGVGDKMAIRRAEASRLPARGLQGTDIAIARRRPNRQAHQARGGPLLKPGPPPGSLGGLSRRLHRGYVNASGSKRQPRWAEEEEDGNRPNDEKPYPVHRSTPFE